LTLDCLLNLQEKYYQCIKFGARCKLEPKRVLIWEFVLTLSFRHYQDTHLGLNKKLTPKIRHENDGIFKNALSKKGLE
jgi:hypothetical protein